MAKRRRSTGAPGNTVEEQRLWEVRVHKFGLALLKLDRLMSSAWTEGRVMDEIRVYKPRGDDGMFMVVVKGRLEKRRVVGFAEAADPSEALRLGIEKYNNQTMRMRTDKPFKPAPQAGSEGGE